MSVDKTIDLVRIAIVITVGAWVLLQILVMLY